MNINEYIYLYFIKDEEAYMALYNHFYPLIVSMMSRTMADMYHMKEEMLEISYQVLYECLEKCRVDRYWYFTSYFKKCLFNRWMDFYNFEMRHDVSLKNETLSLDTKIKEHSNTYHYDLITDGHIVHNQVMMKLERERLDALAQREFSYLELHILSLKRMGMKNTEIANLLHLEPAKVRSILAKMKKWYTMH